MRKNVKLVVPMAALAVAITLSITGQEEPLPVVRAKTSLDGPVREPANYLLVELNRPFDSSLLADAARANDFAAFDALYKGARKLGQPVSAYSTLHELWSWSMSDPVGGFYGQDVHDRFASAFSGYTRYIEEYRIVDNRGNAFYPTSETRAFLLSRALEGQSALSPVVARRAAVRSEERSPAKSQPSRSVTRRSATQGSNARSQRTTAKPKTRVASSPAVAEKAAATPVVKTPATATPAVSQPAGGNAGPATSATITTATNPPTTTSATTTSAPTPAPVVTEPPIVVKADESAPAPITATPVETQTAAPPAATASNPLTNRGMLLLVIGLIGFGILALILRTPKEVPTSILPPTPAGKPPAPVEPFRKTPAPGSQTTEDSKKPRATGSHG